MHDLTEINQLIVVCIIAGFISGALSGVTDDLIRLLIRKERINARSIINKSIVTGFAIGILLTLVNFAYVSVDNNISTQELIKTAIRFAIAFIFAPIVSNLFGFVSSKLFPER